MILEDEPNWFNYQHFYEYISTKQFSTLVEVGVFLGASISFLAKKNQENNKNSFKIYGVDLFDTWCGKDVVEKLYDITGVSDIDRLKKLGSFKFNAVTERLANQNLLSFVELIKEHSEAAANFFEPKSVDFVFIDADHDYLSVKKDIEAWLPKIKNGGIISGHDYEEPSVNKAVKEIFGSQAMEFKQNRCRWYVNIDKTK